MSKGKPPRVYWDACLFLDLVNKTPGRIETLSALWDDLLGSEPKAEAITSMLTIAEVAFGAQEQTAKKLDEVTLAKIEGFWAPPPDSPIQLVELYEGIARDARELIRRAIADGFSLKAHDAVHFATAKRWKATRFLTYDGRLYKFSNKFGFSVEEPKTDQLKLTEAPPPAAPVGTKERDDGTKAKAPALPGPADGGAGAKGPDAGQPGKPDEEPKAEAPKSGTKEDEVAPSPAAAFKRSMPKIEPGEPDLPPVPPPRRGPPIVEPGAAKAQQVPPVVDKDKARELTIKPTPDKPPPPPAPPIISPKKKPDLPDSKS